MLTNSIYFVFSLELRELEAKLRSAYMNKERTAQIAEKEAIKFDVMVNISNIFLTVQKTKLSSALLFIFAFSL